MIKEKLKVQHVFRQMAFAAGCGLIAASSYAEGTTSTADGATSDTPACCGVGQSRLTAMLGAAAGKSTETLAASVGTSATADKPSGPAPEGMAWIPGGTYKRGTDDSGDGSFPGERPAHDVTVKGFWMDKTEVTNEQFAKFVAATGYKTTAETTPTLEEIMSQVPPGTPPPPAEALVPGALVFTPPSHPVELNDETQWWTWTHGADWLHPQGPTSNINGLEKHPVVMVSWFDAQAYAKWAGKRLPTESEWERAARGGLNSNTFVWGNEFTPAGKIMANTWQGTFPNDNKVDDGYARSAPVGSFAPNGFGLFDVAGNVWEWCSDWYQLDLYRNLDTSKPQDNPKGPAKSSNPNHPYQQERSIRGGSFLCHASYCSSYRPSARLGNTPDTGMSHLGFRCVKD